MGFLLTVRYGKTALVYWKHLLDLNDYNYPEALLFGFRVQYHSFHPGVNRPVMTFSKKIKK